VHGTGETQKLPLLDRSLRSTQFKGQRVFMTGFIGIFWGIPNPDHSWSILADKSARAEAEPYGDFLTSSRGHYEVWSEWQQLNAKALAKKAIPQTVLFHEYEDLPRGRIVYHVTTGLFVVYADQRLQHPDVLDDIVNLFAAQPHLLVDLLAIDCQRMHRIALALASMESGVTPELAKLLMRGSVRAVSWPHAR